MKWFYNLKRAIRIVIAVVAWLPLVIFAAAIGGTVGVDAADMQTWEAFVIVVLLAPPIFFLVFAIRARKRETQADTPVNAAKTGEGIPAQSAPVNAATGAQSAAAGVSVRITDDITFPIHTKAVGVTFDGCQERIQKSKVGDALILKHKPTEDYPESTDIINKRTGGRIGRVSSDLAWKFLTAFDEGFVLDAVIADITGGGDGQNYGCNIEIIGESDAE